MQISNVEFGNRDIHFERAEKHSLYESTGDAGGFNHFIDNLSRHQLFSNRNSIFCIETLVMLGVSTT